VNWYRDKTPEAEKGHRKQWHSGRYVVRWRDQIEGISILPGYHALVKVNINDRIILDFVWRSKIFRTRGSAVRACEDHAAGRDPAAEYRKAKQDKILQKRRKRKIKTVPDLLASIAEKPKRKSRSDKGMKRGPRA